MVLPDDKEHFPMFQEQYQTLTKAEVIEQYRKDYEAFLTTFSSFPKRHYGDQVLDSWGIKEILTHMASWDLETIKAIQTVKNGRTPWFLNHEDKVDVFNSEQVEKRKFTSIPDTLAEMEVNHKKLIDFLEQFPEHFWHQGFGNVWRQLEVTPALVCSYRHYATHRKDILNYLKKVQK